MPRDSKIVGAVFFLEIFDENNDSRAGFSSHYFNISDNGAASSTALASLPSATTSSSVQNTSTGMVTSTTSSILAPTTASTTPHTTAASNDIGANAVKLGVGVGVGVGVLCLVAGVGLGWFVWRRRDNGHNRRHDPSGSHSEAFLQPNQDSHGSELAQPASELYGNSPRDLKKSGPFAELPSQSYVPEMGTSRP